MNALKKGIIAISISSILAACGGSESDSSGGMSPDLAQKLLSGTAAAGAAIVGTVTVKGALGKIKSAKIEADGNYNVDVTGLTAPFRLRAQGTVGGKTYKLHSYAEEADIGGTVNITPFTDLIIANVAQDLAENYFDDPILDSSEELSANDLETQETALQAKLQNVFDALGLDTTINLLNSSFSADHSGLDAALDIIKVEVDDTTNTATITNLIDKTTIQDVITDLDDNDDSFAVDSSQVTEIVNQVSETQAITALIESFASKFVSGLPTPTVLQPFFADNFLNDDQGKAEFLTDITSDPELIDLKFSSVSVTGLDLSALTASVSFNLSFDDSDQSDTITMFMAKNNGQWQLLGDQHIVDLSTLSFHCYDYNKTDGIAGSCGLNTSFDDRDINNNGSSVGVISSASVSIIDGSNGTTVKDVFFIGTPNSDGEGQIYNETAGGYYSGDWRAFGTAANEIAASTFVAGDIVEYKLFTQALDTSDQTNPSVADGTEVATYRSNILYPPSTVGLYPTINSASLTALQNYSLGSNLAISWSLADGTVSSEVVLSISDDQGNKIEVSEIPFATSATSTTFASASLDTSNFDQTAQTYHLLVRIYARDAITSQEHSVYYESTIAGPAATNGGGGSNTGGGSNSNNTISCGFETPYNDATEEPLTFNSYDQFITVVNDCGGALSITSSDLIGTFEEGYTNGSGQKITRQLNFYGDGTGTSVDLIDGVIDQSIPLTWSIAANNFITINLSVNNITAKYILASTSANNEFTTYGEVSNWSSMPNLTTFNGDLEGEIDHLILFKQSAPSGN